MVSIAILWTTITVQGRLDGNGPVLSDFGIRYWTFGFFR